MRNHELKCDTEYYQQVELGNKTFEVRYDDRGYEVGDTVELIEVAGHEAVKTGRKLQPKEIIYILCGGQFGIRDGFVVLQLK